MVEEKLLTIRDVAIMLAISEKEVIDLAESGKIPAYKVGGVYLRFKRSQVEEFRKSGEHPAHKRDAVNQKPSFPERLSDFIYFNDFYIVSAIIIALIFIVIFRGR